MLLMFTTLPKAAKKTWKPTTSCCSVSRPRYYGEAQCDWDDFFPTLEEIDFNGKLVALFGCGDQEDYAEYFCDALGTIRDIIEPRGATIVGHWPTAGYHFEASKGLGG